MAKNIGTTLRNKYDVHSPPFNVTSFWSIFNLRMKQHNPTRWNEATMLEEMEEIFFLLSLVWFIVIIIIIIIIPLFLVGWCARCNNNNNNNNNNKRVSLSMDQSEHVYLGYLPAIFSARE